MDARKAARHLSNDWIVRIVGGLIAAVLTAYVLALLGVGSAASSSKLPAQSHGEQLALQIDPGLVSATDHTPIALYIGGAKPNLFLSVDGYDPSGTTFIASGTRSNDHGKASLQLVWPPEGRSHPEPGPWRLTVYDPGTGASAVGYLVVTGSSQ